MGSIVSGVIGAYTGGAGKAATGGGDAMSYDKNQGLV